MRNKVVILVLVTAIVLCSSFSVFASTSCDVSFSEPATGDNQGYLAVMDSSGNSNVFFWNISPYSYSDSSNIGSSPSMNITISDDRLEFTALCTGTARVTLTRVYNSTSQYVCLSRSFTTSVMYSHDSMSDIQYYCYDGNIGIFVDDLSSSNNFLSVNWGNDNSYQSNLDSLVSKLNTIDSKLYDLAALLGKSNSYVDDVEEKLDSINSSLSGLDSLASSLEDTNKILESIENEIDGIEESLTIMNGKLDSVLYWLELINSNILLLNKNLLLVNDNILQINRNLVLINDNLLLTNDNVLLVNKNLLLMNDNLLQINRNLLDTNQKLQSIINMFDEFMNSVGEESTGKLDDSAIGSLGEYENSVIEDNSDDLDDLSLSFGNSFDVVWDLISDAWQANSKVFTLVIMCLTIGLLKLILNR